MTVGSRGPRALSSNHVEAPRLRLRLPIPAVPDLDLEGLAVGADRLVLDLVVEPAPRQRSNQVDLALLDRIHLEIG